MRNHKSLGPDWLLTQRDMTVDSNGHIFKQCVGTWVELLLDFLELLYLDSKVEIF